MNRRALLLFAASAALSGMAYADEAAKDATLYKNPGCACCDSYADYLRENGLRVKVIASDDMDAVKKRHGVPAQLEGCHSTVIDGYVVEGHVPISAVNKLLTKRPQIRGISLPDMPTGSPGMGGRKKAPFVVLEIGSGEPKVFAVE